ncbi:hypothetical protein AAFF_G00272630 [Aldrovandia affinis]|uniref:Uncharacterized protein n=1 Tax=Aldrovandia affinis TaxID=143900 RepID=A0AAD7RAJ4_9TELE|nr:hypothetical protein AAFF_G00272630 [Aldrovandia affinis]
MDSGDVVIPDYSTFHRTLSIRRPPSTTLIYKSKSNLLWSHDHETHEQSAGGRGHAEGEGPFPRRLRGVHHKKPPVSHLHRDLLKKRSAAGSHDEASTAHRRETQCVQYTLRRTDSTSLHTSSLHYQGLPPGLRTTSAPQQTRASPV